MPDPLTFRQEYVISITNTLCGIMFIDPPKVKFRKMHAADGNCGWDKTITVNSQMMNTCFENNDLDRLHEVIHHELIHYAGNMTHNKAFYKECRAWGLPEANIPYGRWKKTFR